MTTMPKKTLAVPKEGWLQFTLIMLLLSLLLVGNAHADDEPKVTGKIVRSITVGGQSERKMAPDQAFISVNISATSAELSAAKAEHDKKLKEVMDAAEKAGVEKAQMNTQNSSTMRLYEWEKKQRRFKGYRILTNVYIKIKNVSAVGGLYDKLSNMGLEKDAGQQYGSVLSVNYSIADEDKIRDELKAEAIKDARKKADDMAAAAGTSVIGVIQIAEPGVSISIPRTDIPYMPAPAMASMTAMAKGRIEEETARVESEYVAPPVGEQTITSNVTVMFELK